MVSDVMTVHSSLTVGEHLSLSTLCQSLIKPYHALVITVLISVVNVELMKK